MGTGVVVAVPHDLSISFIGWTGGSAGRVSDLWTQFRSDVEASGRLRMGP